MFLGSLHSADLCRNFRRPCWHSHVGRSGLLHYQREMAHRGCSSECDLTNGQSLLTTQQPAYLGAVLIPPAMIFIKLTFFLVYLQMFRPFAWLRFCVYIGSATTTAFHLGVWIYLLVSLTPRNGQSFMTVARSSAYSKSQRTSVTIAGVRVATDLYLLVLPIAAVVQLQLPTRRKIGVILIFLTGLALVPCSPK